MLSFSFRFVGGSVPRGTGCARSAEGRRGQRNMCSRFYIFHMHTNAKCFAGHISISHSIRRAARRGETRLSRRAISAVSLLRSNESSRSDGVRRSRFIRSSALLIVLLKLHWRAKSVEWTEGACVTIPSGGGAPLCVHGGALYRTDSGGRVSRRLCSPVVTATSIPFY